MAGRRCGTSWSWNELSSSASQSGGSGASATSQSGRPMLPAVSARSPAAAIAWAMSDVVVVLPLVPVIPTQRVRFPSARNPTSTSAYTSRPASRARASGGTSGGTPGATTTAAARAMRSRSCPPSWTVAPQRGELLRPPLVRRPRPGVRRVHRQALVPEQLRRRRAALAEAHHGDFPAGRAPLLEQLDRHPQRTFSVESATSAQNRPRM